MSSMEREVPEIAPPVGGIALPRPARSRLAARSALCLAVAVAAGAVAGLAGDPPRLWTDLLVDGVYFLSLALAGALFLAVQYLTRAGWWVAIRRVPEAMMAAVPVAGGLTLAVCLGLPELYPWARPALVARDPLLAARSRYLSPGPFAARMALFLALWTLFALLLRRASLAQDRAPGFAHHRRLVRLSAAFVLVFAVTFSLASFEWLMSLDPHWYSTIFAVYLFAGLLLAGVAAITLAAVLLSRREPLARAVNPSHLHDLGKLLFAFSTFWAYIWVSQYLLIWYSNIPEEAEFYVTRLHGGFRLPFFLVLGMEWIVPFVALMPRAAKRRPKVLLGVSALVLLGHWLDLYLLVAPPVLARMRLGATELLVAAGYAAVFLLAAGRALGRAPLLAANDPLLEESLRHHQ
jgi:hypothetical protein